MQTQQSRYVACLLAKGFTKLPADTSSRYIVMFKDNIPLKNGGVGQLYIWCGNNGALRANNVKNVSGSRSLTDAYKTRLLATAAQPTTCVPMHIGSSSEVR